MKRHLAAAAAILILFTGAARADTSFAPVAEAVNKKMVKLFGSGGFKGIVAYGTGILVSADGYVLTVAGPMLDTRDLRVHLADGRRYHAKVIVMEPELDVALVKIEPAKDEVLELDFFDVSAAAKKPLVKAGTGVLAFSNQFEIATRDEPMSVMKGTIASYTRLQGRRGIHEATYKDNVYVLDAITNNPGAGGGALTTRKGELLGIIGKELRNELTNTWINYAVPIQASVEVLEKDDKKRMISILEIVEKKEKYAATTPDREKKKADNYTGLVLVPNAVELTPPYVEEVLPDSPAAKAGLKTDDLIVYVDGEPINSINHLLDLFGRIRPETPMRIEVRRGDKLTTLNMVMGKPLAKKPKPTPPPRQP